MRDLIDLLRSGDGGQEVVPDFDEFLIGHGLDLLLDCLAIGAEQLLFDESVEHARPHRHALEACHNGEPLEHGHDFDHGGTRQHCDPVVLAREVEGGHTAQCELYFLNFELFEHDVRHDFQDAFVSVDLLEDDDGFSSAGTVDICEEDVVEELLHGDAVLLATPFLPLQMARGLDGLAGTSIPDQPETDVLAAQLDDDIFPLRVLHQSIYFHMQGEQGCKHYRRKCRVEAPCCRIIYPCKLCHDEQYQFKKGCQVQRMDFAAVINIQCSDCNCQQPPSTNCSNCGIIFGLYTCLLCKLFENDPAKAKDIFHCEECKLCRRGKRENFVHCRKCGYCVGRNNTEHLCMENASESNCPICLQTLHFSRESFMNLRCGHLIHCSCFKKYQNINCPTCGMAIEKLSKEQIEFIEEEINQTKDILPPELKSIRLDVICNECLHKTMQAPYHFVGVKCEKCGTYNTKKI